MLRWHDIIGWPVAELARLDVAATNLACAHGLPGSDRLDWEQCFRTLDGWTEGCRRFTDRMMPHFHAGRGDYPESEAKFRIQGMITHLQRDLGVRYHPDRKAEDAVFRPEDSFVHGIIQGQGGTCGNLPVLYAAVGRRLGYPIRLVTTKGHLFCRWDAGPGGESFNIEASGEGVSFFPDEHYRTGRFAMPPETVAACGYLKSQSPREELAGFLCQRAECWMQERDYREAAVAFAWAHELDPARQQYAFLTQQAMRVWKQTLARRAPQSPHFPMLDLGLPAPHFQRMPRDAERELIGLTVTERLLDEPKLNCDWWHALRVNPNQRPAGMPARISVDFRWTAADRGVTISPFLSEA